MNKKLLVLHHCLGMLPVVYAGFYISTHSEFFKPLLHFFGNVAIVLLCGIIILGLLKQKIKNQKFSESLLKLMGFYILFYVCLHLGLYIFTEIFWTDFFMEVRKRAYLLIGFIAFLIIILLNFLTLFNKKMFFKFSSLSYVAGLLASVHFLLGQKIPSTLSYIFFAIFLILICSRLYKKDKI